MTTSNPRRAVCCACAQQCGLLVHTHDDQVVRITGDPDHPSSAGFICPKGSRAHELHQDPDRIHYPLKRVGERGAGKWQRVSWNEALDDIASKLQRFKDQHGPESVAYSFGTLHGAEWGIGERFMNLFGSPNSIGQDKICYGPTAVGETLTYGFGPSVFSYPIPGETRVVVVWGMRPSASAPLLWRAILRARAAGAKLVVIDPEFTKEARKADHWLQLTPGADVALALGLLNVLVTEKLYDADIARESVGFDSFAERTAEYDLERVTKITGVPAAEITQVARLIASEGPTLFSAGNGLCQAGNMAVQNGRVIACLIALTGNLNRLGGNALAGPPRDMLSNGLAVAADRLSDAQRAKRLGAQDYPFVGEGYAALDAAMAERWYGQPHILSWIATAHEPSLWSAIEASNPYPVKALILQHHNPVGSSANLERVQRALANPNLELLVSHDLFLNATSRLADYVLPAAHWLERPFFSYGFGYMAFVGDYAEAGDAPIGLQYEHRGDYDLWRDLAARLDQAESWPCDARDFWESLVTPAGLTFEKLASQLGPVTGPAVQSDDPPDGAMLNSSAYGTPSGKIEFSSTLLDDWGLDPLPYFARPSIFDNEAAFPLILTTGGRKIEGFHQHAQQTECFRRKNPEPLVSVHPDTAASIGIADNEFVSIETPVGAIQQRIRLHDGLAAGVVHADRWWYPEDADNDDDPYRVRETNINCCTADAHGDTDPVIGSWLLRGVPCRLVKLRDAG